MHENSQYPKFLETLKSIQQNFPVLWVKQIDAKTGQPPSFINSLLSTPEIFWNTDSTLTKISVLRSKKTFQQIYMLPSFAWKPSMPDFFWNKEGFPCEICRDYETKMFQQRTVISISNAWKFSIPEVSRNIEEYPTKFSGTVSQTNWRKNGTTPIFYQ